MGNQIADKTEKFTLVGTEEFAIQNTGGGLTQKTQTDTIYDYIAALVGDPVGTVKAWDKTFPSTPALSASYVECDGALISDGDSVYNAYRSRNLNGANVVLSLTYASGVATAAATDVTALAIGDDVTGAGIAAGSTITNIVTTTVTISDASASGSISSTFTNRGRFLRGNSTSGDGANDAGQTITGTVNGNTSIAFQSSDGCLDIDTATSSGSNTGSRSGSQNMSFNSSNSTSPNAAKTDDDETRPINLDVVYIMKIK